MALIDLQSDLTSLKYGSKLPAVRHKMGNKTSQATARIDDVKRLGVILTQAPGLKFAANQSLLQSAKIGSAIGNKLGSGGSVGGAVLAGLGAAFKATVGTGLFLTANAAKAGTGFHGVNPSVAVSYLNATRSSVDSTVTSGDSNFLDKVISTVSAVATAIGAQSSNYHAAQEILGGSVEISKDTIENPLYTSVGKEQGTKTIQYSSTATVDQSGKVTKDLKESAIRKKAFDKEIEDKERYLQSKDRVYGGDNIKEYYQKDGGKGDKLQKQKVLEEALGVDEQDIIPFEFNFYTPGSETDKYIYFRAFLDSLSDSYNATWSGIKYIGRAEEFYTYSGFGRTMSFSFKAAAFSKEELEPIYQKLNHLVGSTAPTYGSDKLFMRGTLLKLTIGDYIKAQNGFLSSVSLTWNTDYPWEIGDDMKVPHLLDVSCEFTPIHSFNPEFGIDEKKFIGV